jgi:retinol dehydrogenase 14
MRPVIKTPDQGAVTSINLAAHPRPEQVTGCYFANSKAKRSAKRSHDKTAAARLWQVSTDLVNPGPQAPRAVDGVTS